LTLFGTVKPKAQQDAKKITIIPNSKSFKFDDLKLMSPNKGTAMQTPGANNVVKYLSNGKPVNVRVISDIDVTRAPINYISNSKTDPNRPTTAPNKVVLKKDMQESPYYSSENYNTQPKESKEKVERPNSKGGIFPQAEAAKIVIKKSQLRSMSPGNTAPPGVGNFFTNSFRPTNTRNKVKL